MNATSNGDDDIDLEFSFLFEGQPKPAPDAAPKPAAKPAPKPGAKPAPSLATSTEAQRKAVNEGAAKLRQAGYCINIVRPATRVAPLAPGAKRYILCIDDDVPLVQILARKLTFDGYQVRTASDRETILAELKKLPSPDLILLDVGLPGISGFDILTMLRKHPKLGSIPVIMLTGNVSPEDVLRGMTSGADGYVSKPFQFDALAVAIKSVIGMQ